MRSQFRRNLLSLALGQQKYSRSFFTLPLSDTIPILSEKLKEEKVTPTTATKFLAVPAGPAISASTAKILSILPPACFFFFTNFRFENSAFDQKKAFNWCFEPVAICFTLHKLPCLEWLWLSELGHDGFDTKC